MSFKISPKKKQSVIIRQGNICGLCGGKLKKNKIHFHELDISEETDLPSLISSDIPNNVKALCDECHYEQEMESKIKQFSKTRKISKSAKVVMTGGMTINVKDSDKKTK